MQTSEGMPEPRDILSLTAYHNSPFIEIVAKREGDFTDVFKRAKLDKLLPELLQTYFEVIENGGGNNFDPHKHVISNGSARYVGLMPRKLSVSDESIKYRKHAEDAELVFHFYDHSGHSIYGLPDTFVSPIKEKLSGRFDTSKIGRVFYTTSLSSSLSVEIAYRESSAIWPEKHLDLLSISFMSAEDAIKGLQGMRKGNYTVYDNYFNLKKKYWPDGVQMKQGTEFKKEV